MVPNCPGKPSNQFAFFLKIHLVLSTRNRNPTRNPNSKIQLEILTRNPTQNPNLGVSLSPFFVLVIKRNPNSVVAFTLL